MYFAIDKGYVVRAQLKVVSEAGGSETVATHTVEANLTRVAGNTTGLTPPANKNIAGAASAPRQ